MSTTQQNLAQQYFLENLVRLMKAWTNYLELDELKRDVFLKLGTVPDSKWRKVEKKDHWIRRTIKHCRLDRYSKGAREAEKVTRYGASLDTTKMGQNPFNAYQARILVKQFYDTCSEDERSLLRLYIFGYEGTEIARNLSISHVAARQRVARLVEKFRQFVDSGDKDPP